MHLELDTVVKALSLRIVSGRMADSRELAVFVVADYDESGRMLSIEFVQTEDFGPFIREHPDLATLPSRLA